ncbi:hypothetical protein MFLAVUS_003552 [Mucor flavus]|uniref:Uncharacterized protein n=1 Tax=Mucor flavus TaxID=439312 RepID=A0ABP9YTF1_9FUNG
MTSQFLSLITTLPKETDGYVAATHVVRSFLLTLRFIVLVTILSGKELYTLTAAITTTKNRDSCAKIKKPAHTPVMQPNATLTLESTTRNGTEPITVSPVSSKNEPAKLQKQTISSNNNNVAVAQDKITMPKVPVIDRQKSPPVSSVASVQLGDKKESRPTPTISHVSSDQPMKREIDLEKPSSLDNTTSIVLDNKKEQLDGPIINEHEALDLSITDSIPSLKSDDSSSIKQSSDVSKEPYYKESIKKDSNLMSLPDNTQQLFDELTAISTPVPSDNAPNRFYGQHERTSSTQPSIEETVPGLSPHPSTSVSRKSSITSQGSVMKGVLKSTLSKMSRKNSVREQPPLPQQQTMTPVTHDLVPSASTSTKRSSKLLHFKLGRKKSVTNTVSKKEQQQQQQQQQRQQQQATADDDEEEEQGDSPKKRTFSIRVKNKLKNIVHRKTS